MARTKVQAAPQLPSELLDLKGVATYLKASRSKVYRLMNEEGLPYFKVGDSLRFDPRKLAVWLEQQQQRSA